MPIQEITRAKIKGYLEAFIENTVDKHKTSKIFVFNDPESYLAQKSAKHKLKPFHAAVIPQEIMRLSEIERSFSTSLGSTFEECARLIASDYHKEAFRNFDLAANVSSSSIREINNILARYENDSNSHDDDKTQKPSLVEMLDTIFSAWNANNIAQRRIRSDLYIRTNENQELYFEIKSPVPNKDQCFRILERILTIHLLQQRKRSEVRAYFAMAYNPYGPSRDDYKWSIPKLYLPFDEVTLIGHEFWELIGGPNTYEELLEIYQEVGQHKSKYIIDTLLFGF